MSEIYKAEAVRVKGNRNQKIAELRRVRGMGQVVGRPINHLDVGELVEKMQWWRIWVSMLGSLASGSWNGNEAAEFLKESRGVITQYYDNQMTQTAALLMVNDREGHEYEMAAHMERDRGKHWMKLATLTGQTQYLMAANTKFRKAAVLASTGSGARSLVCMERMMMDRKLGKSYRFGEFRAAYEHVIELSPQAGGVDQAAVASWWFVKEAMAYGHRQEMNKGLKNLNIFCEEMGVSWVNRYLRKDLVGVLIAWCQKRTFTGDAHELELRTSS
jgi:hypothetical protein